MDALPAFMRDLAAFSLATGLRQSNALGLRWDQLDFSRRCVVIRGISMKNKRDFGLPLNDTAVEIIRQQIGSVFVHNGQALDVISSKCGRGR